MPYLIILEGPRDGEKLYITSDETTIGRAEDNNIALQGPDISGHHCLIRHQEDDFLVMDLDSTNGTSINDRPINEAILHRGDILTLGTTPLRVEGDDLPLGENLNIQNAENTTEEPPETQHITIQPRTRKTPSPVPKIKDFGKRRDERRVWIVIIALLSISVIGAIVWLIHRLMSA